LDNYLEYTVQNRRGIFLKESFSSSSKLKACISNDAQQIKGRERSGEILELQTPDPHGTCSVPLSPFLHYFADYSEVSSFTDYEDGREENKMRICWGSVHGFWKFGLQKKNQLSGTRLKSTRGMEMATMIVREM
ncbi:hypothetical protein AVEN_126429-1, partial [Araneus ventricosus]